VKAPVEVQQALLLNRHPSRQNVTARHSPISSAHEISGAIQGTSNDLKVTTVTHKVTARAIEFQNIQIVDFAIRTSFLQQSKLEQAKQAR
jgi:hypothetical protein